MKNKSLFSRLLENKKVMLVVSFVIAFIFWMISSDNTTMTIDNIPLRPILSESAIKENLKVYSISPETVSVNVTGKRVIINALSENDFTASVDLFNVTTAGSDTYTVEIDSNSNRSFTVSGSKPLRVTVFVDKEVEKEISVKKLLSYTPEGYYVTDNLPPTVTVKGPESIVNKVKSAYVKDEIVMAANNQAYKTLTVHLSDNINPADPSAEDINSEFLELNNDSLVSTFNFMNLKNNVPFEIKFSDSDIVIPLEYYSTDPSSISIATKDDIEINKVQIDLGSISKYKNAAVKETINIENILNDDYICVNNDVNEVVVDIDFSSFAAKRFVIGNEYVESTGLKEEFKLQSSISVLVIGKSSVIESLSEEDFNITCDFTNVHQTADSPIVVPAKVNINSDGLCWAYNPANTFSVQLGYVM